MMVNRSLVSVVDDDESVRESLPDLLRECGFSVQAFSSAEEFLRSDSLHSTRCLILDVSMPGMSGPESRSGFGPGSAVFPCGLSLRQGISFDRIACTRPAV